MKVRLLLILVAFLVGCDAAPLPHAPVHFELVGSDSMQWLAQSLTNAYSQQRPYATFTIRQANPEAGLSAASTYSGTIGLVSRAIKPVELNGTRAVVVARDGIAIIVNKANPINAIQHSQIADVFSGAVLVWPTGPLGGKNIIVVSREAGSGTRDAFETMAMNGARVTRTAVVMPGEAAVVDYVAHHPEAIGYCSLGGLTEDVNSLIVDEVALSPQTVESKKYPFIRALSFVVPLKPDPEMQDFLNFALGSDGQRIIGQRFGRAQ